MRERLKVSVGPVPRLCAAASKTCTRQKSKTPRAASQPYSNSETLKNQAEPEISSGTYEIHFFSPASFCKQILRSTAPSDSHREAKKDILLHFLMRREACKLEYATKSGEVSRASCIFLILLDTFFLEISPRSGGPVSFFGPEEACDRG